MCVGFSVAHINCLYHSATDWLYVAFHFHLFDLFCCLILSMCACRWCGGFVMILYQRLFIFVVFEYRMWCVPSRCWLFLLLLLFFFFSCCCLLLLIVVVVFLARTETVPLFFLRSHHFLVSITIIRRNNVIQRWSSVYIGVCMCVCVAFIPLSLNRIAFETYQARSAKKKPNHMCPTVDWTIWQRQQHQFDCSTNVSHLDAIQMESFLFLVTLWIVWVYFLYLLCSLHMRLSKVLQPVSL